VSLDYVEKLKHSEISMIHAHLANSIATKNRSDYFIGMEHCWQPYAA
jgi:hypothetical protein